MNDNWGVTKSYDNSETKEVLGINFIDWKTSVNEMVPTLVDTEYIPRGKV